MEFGIDKCATIVLKREKLVKLEGIKLPDGKYMKSLNEGDGYKYLRVTEADEIKKKETKEKVGKEYKRRIRKILETKLGGENVIKGINTWAISLLRYSAAFLDWTKEELQQLDRRTRKLLRGLLNVEDTVHLAIIGLLKYVGNSEERLLNTARQALGHVEETEKEYKIRRENERKQIWKDRVLHDQFMRQTEEEGGKERWL